LIFELNHVARSSIGRSSTRHFVPDHWSPLYAYVDECTHARIC
jgi:hypothetical protein